MDVILSTKLKNAIKSYVSDMSVDYMLKNISINGRKKGCSGFVRNNANNAIIYVDTEEPCVTSLHYMYRYADHDKDYRGYHNRWANSLDELAKEISILLRTPVSEAHEYKV